MNTNALEPKAPTGKDRWLIRICGALIVLNLFWIPLGIASIPRYIQRVTTLTIPTYGIGIGSVLTNASVLADAGARGMSLATYAWYLLGIRMAAAAVFTGVGALLLLRARGHWFGWFTALVMFFLNSYAFYQPLQVALIVPAALIDLGSVFWPIFLLYFFLFPNGRLEPPWLRWPVVVYAVVHFLLQLAGFLIQAGLIQGEYFDAILGPFEVGILLVFGLALGSQVYRYTRIATSLERAQLRWIIYGVVVLLGVPLLADLIGVGRYFETFEWGTISLTMAPITLAIAILRYRLWDIDLVIRRTLQYTLLTGLLALVFFGLVILLQGLFTSADGQQVSPLVNVISTLAVAALFNPLRRWVQAFIDRRFYRAKYNADQVLQEFAAAARNEVDMDRLVSELTRITRTTMQPETISIWVKAPPRKKGKK